MIASLGWYPATRPVWDRLWPEVRARLGFGPPALTWPEDFGAHWRHPDLLLAFTCSLPLRLGLSRHVHLVGTPVWDLPGLPAGHYASHLVAQASDRRPLAVLAEAGIAINAVDSQSGWGALADAGLTGPATVTGSHAASLNAVASGECAMAAIDAVTWAMAPRDDVAIRATTPPTPAPPFVTARPDLVPTLFDALAGAIAAMPATDRRAIRLAGLVRLDDDAYAAPPPVPPVLSTPRAHCNPPGFAA
ncbi:PhnD/SsuA/transferrin family substrate-binding protein [Jannaschia sp. S6380]|uniref:phosphate/phosphite/phosphonate ABC transporter substrate-binding protein n=1 Tax=Jannaschia sp. S6380 TaxID=2926408 RepID=UPI001FF6833D|nr:PhnD/SsuA/transferrin family substrate-binding protein [Jannaschia sp. S6380]MCK0167790.1 PhnD/SsuA/transferrin family substrate-binding protein [Jannaschia sp. S6380]